MVFYGKVIDKCFEAGVRTPISVALLLELIDEVDDHPDVDTRIAAPSKLDKPFLLQPFTVQLVFWNRLVLSTSFQSR